MRLFDRTEDKVWTATDNIYRAEEQDYSLRNIRIESFPLKQKATNTVVPSLEAADGMAKTTGKAIQFILDGIFTDNIYPFWYIFNFKLELTLFSACLILSLITINVWQLLLNASLPFRVARGDKNFSSFRSLCCWRVHWPYLLQWGY